jgi:hypothetical protein
MSDEFGRWNELAKLWHAHAECIPALDVERHANRQRRQMLLVAAAEAVCMSLSLAAAIWIAMQTTFIALSAISTVFFALSAFLDHRMRREPASAGGHDLLSSLRLGLEREGWNLSQLRIGRAVTLATLLAIGMMMVDHLRHYSDTPPARLWALVSVFLIVVATLVLNWRQARQARMRLARLEHFARQMADGPEFQDRSGR